MPIVRNYKFAYLDIFYHFNFKFMANKKSNETASHPENNGFVLWQLSNQWQRGLNSVLKEYDLTHVQYILLEAIVKLDDSQDSVYQKELADYANANTMMTSKVLRSLEQKGFIHRVGHEYDTRAKDVSITKDGRALFKKVSKRVDQYDNQFFGQLGPKQTAFTSALQTLSGK